jgi:hypothetical protein
MAYLRKPLGSRKFELCTITCGNLQFIAQISVVELQKQIHNPLNVCRLDVATRKYQSLVHTCGVRMEAGLTTVLLLMNEDFGPLYSTIQKLYNSWEL